MYPRLCDAIVRLSFYLAVASNLCSTNKPVMQVGEVIKQKKMVLLVIFLTRICV